MTTPTSPCPGNYGAAACRQVCASAPYYQSSGCQMAAQICNATGGAAPGCDEFVAQNADLLAVNSWHNSYGAFGVDTMVTSYCRRHKGEAGVADSPLCANILINDEYGTDKLTLPPPCWWKPSSELGKRGYVTREMRDQLDLVGGKCPTDAPICLNIADVGGNRNIVAGMYQCCGTCSTSWLVVVFVVVLATVLIAGLERRGQRRVQREIAELRAVEKPPV